MPETSNVKKREHEQHCQETYASYASARNYLASAFKKNDLPACLLNLINHIFQLQLRHTEIIKNTKSIYKYRMDPNGVYCLYEGTKAV